MAEISEEGMNEEEFKGMLAEITGAPPSFTIPEECIDRAKPIHNLALKLYSAAVMTGVYYWPTHSSIKAKTKQKIKDYLDIVITDTRLLLEGKVEKFPLEYAGTKHIPEKLPLEYGLDVAERAKKLIDEGYIGTAAADLATAGWTLGEFHMLESARCICSIRSGDSRREAAPHKTYWERQRELGSVR